MPRIAVIGGTGYAGSHIVAEAVQRGHTVVSVARSVPAERVEGATYIEGTVLDVPGLVAELEPVPAAAATPAADPAAAASDAPTPAPVAAPAADPTDPVAVAVSLIAKMMLACFVAPDAQVCENVPHDPAVTLDPTPPM